LDDGSGGLARILEDVWGIVEDCATAADRRLPEYGNFELAQAATITSASIEQPTSKVFDIFTASSLHVRPCGAIASIIVFVTGRMSHRLFMTPACALETPGFP
jgi:hypothetical protein